MFNWKSLQPPTCTLWSREAPEIKVQVCAKKLVENMADLPELWYHFSDHPYHCLLTQNIVIRPLISKATLLGHIVISVLSPSVHVLLRFCPAQKPESKKNCSYVFLFCWLCIFAGLDDNYTKKYSYFLCNFVSSRPAKVQTQIAIMSVK